jgi:coenzyme F420-reducing hydrogenase alpha subunit
MRKKTTTRKVPTKKATTKTSRTTSKPTKRITLNHITKIEGHASLTIKVEKGVVKEVDLFSEEGARFFEGLVVGRNYDDTVEMTSRICGICSTAHITAALKALERAMDVKPSKSSMLMRELLAIGERIRSHATHLYFLALPDYLGYESALAMAPKFKKEISDALDLMKLGNSIIEVFGGRQIHPVGAVIGGMTLTPKPKHLENLKEQLKKAKEQSLRTLDLFAGLSYPNFERETEYFCLEPHGQMPMLTGHLIGSGGQKFDEKEYDKHFTEFMDTRGTSKNMVKKGKSYRVGALARLNLNPKMISARSQKVLKKHKRSFPSNNPFHTNIAQAVEIRYWINRAEQLLKHKWPETKEEFIVKPHAGQGVGAVEAPRGVLFHDYVVDKNGKVKKANIITPTVQNLRAMEDDIKEYLPSILHLSKGDIALEIEKLIRSYDPCFSCSTHFLDIKWA